MGSIIIGVIKTNAFGFSLFGHPITFVSNLFGAGFDPSQLAFTYMGHGLMIGSGMVALIQCGKMLLAKNADNSSAASQFTSSMKGMRGAMGKGFLAYTVVALGLAVVCGFLSEMNPAMFVLWILFAAMSALVSEMLVGVAAMHSGWFPGFATSGGAWSQNGFEMPQEFLDALRCRNGNLNIVCGRMTEKEAL